MSTCVKNRKDRYRLSKRDGIACSYHLSILWLSLYFVGISFFLIVTPKYADDQWYLSNLGDWLLNRDVFFITDGINPFKVEMPWKEMADTICFHYEHDTARIGNMIVMQFLLLPKWIGSGLCSMAWIYAVCIGLKISDVDWRNSPLVLVAVALWYFGMPWPTHLGGLVHQFNYLIPSAIAMYLLMILKNRQKQGGHIAAVVFVLSIILGAWHEGFALPMVSGLLSVMIFYRECRTAKGIMALTGLVIGVFYIMTAPSLTERASTLNLYYLATPWDMVKRLGKIVIVFHPLLLVLFVLEIIYCIKFNFRLLLHNSFIVFITVSACASILLSFATTGSERSGWWNDLIVPVGILLLLREMKWLDNGHIFINKLICWVIGTLTVASLLLTDIYTVRIARECRNVISECVEHKRFVIYNDWLSEFDAPLVWFTKIDTYHVGWEFLLPPCENNKYGLRNPSGSIRVLPESARRDENDSAGISNEDS